MAALKPWYKVVTPREDLRESKPLDASEFAVHLDQVRDGRAPAVYKNPEDFLDRTYLTRSLLELAGQVVRRLSGEKTETSAVFNLATQFGGGKTHALTLLYHLAKNGPKSHSWAGVRSILDRAGVASVPEAAVAVFVGTEFDSISGRGGEDGTPLRKTPWGEIAWQLGGEAGFTWWPNMTSSLLSPRATCTTSASASTAGWSRSPTCQPRGRAGVRAHQDRLPDEARRARRGAGRALLRQVPRSRVEFRVSFTPSVHAQKLVLRILDQRFIPHAIGDLGMATYMTDRIRRVCQQDHGLLLVCGPTGSGKTTTLYNALREIDRDTRNVVTIEDPVEYQLEGTTQIPADHDRGNTFGSLLRSVLRQDPDASSSARSATTKPPAPPCRPR